MKGSESAVRAGSEARELVRRVAVEAFGATVVEEPVERFERLTRTGLDEPLAGVRAARLVSDVAAGALREWALAARGAGRSWADVADALDLREDEDAPSPAEAAWTWLIEHRPPLPRWSSRTWPPSAVWTCGTCQGRVRDTGPFTSHPNDCEQGHAPGCSRHAAEVTAWQQRTGWDDEDDQVNDEDHQDHEREGGQR